MRGKTLAALAAVLLASIGRTAFALVPGQPQVTCPTTAVTAYQWQLGGKTTYTVTSGSTSTTILQPTVFPLTTIVAERKDGSNYERVVWYCYAFVTPGVPFTPDLRQMSRSYYKDDGNTTRNSPDRGVMRNITFSDDATVNDPATGSQLRSSDYYMNQNVAASPANSGTPAPAGGIYVTEYCSEIQHLYRTSGAFAGMKSTTSDRHSSVYLTAQVVPPVGQLPTVMPYVDPFDGYLTLRLPKASILVSYTGTYDYSDPVTGAHQAETITYADSRLGAGGSITFSATYTLAKAGVIAPPTTTSIGFTSRYSLDKTGNMIFLARPLAPATVASYQKLIATLMAAPVPDCLAGGTTSGRKDALSIAQRALSVP